METKTGEIPNELKQKLKGFDRALTDIENKLDPLLKKPQVEINTELNTLDKAKLDLVSTYTINSLFWMYLNVCGVNPKEHGIKQELDRIRSYMTRVKDIQEAEKAKETKKMTVNASAAKRVVKSALWEAAKKKTESKGELSTTATTANESFKDQYKGEKRRSEGSNEELRKKKNEDVFMLVWECGRYRGQSEYLGHFRQARNSVGYNQKKSFFNCSPETVICNNIVYV